jgi:hypothetical protein
MFIVHMIFFHGRQAHSLDGAASAQNSKEALVENPR